MRVLLMAIVLGCGGRRPGRELRPGPPSGRSVLLCRLGMSFDCARVGGRTDRDPLRRQHGLADLADPDLEQALVVAGVDVLGGHALR